jgi:hypothetical protein
MGIPRAEMLARVSSKELSEWMAFYALEPFGYHAEFAGHAQTQSVIANAHRDPKKQKAFKTEDFMPKYDKPKNQSVDSMIAMAAQITAMMGGEDLRE